MILASIWKERISRLFNNASKQFRLISLASFVVVDEFKTWIGVGVGGSLSEKVVVNLELGVDVSVSFFVHRAKMVILVNCLMPSIKLWYKPLVYSRYFCRQSNSNTELAFSFVKIGRHKSLLKSFLRCT
jgi:hypothetical protein